MIPSSEDENMNACLLRRFTNSAILSPSHRTLFTLEFAPASEAQPSHSRSSSHSRLQFLILGPICVRRDTSKRGRPRFGRSQVTRRRIYNLYHLLPLTCSRSTSWTKFFASRARDKEHVACMRNRSRQSASERLFMYSRSHPAR